MTTIREYEDFRYGLLGKKQLIPTLKLIHHTADGRCMAVELTDVEMIIQAFHNSCPSVLEIWSRLDSHFSVDCSRERDDS